MPCLGGRMVAWTATTESCAHSHELETLPTGGLASTGNKDNTISVFETLQITHW
jgi:hypothetical protein